MSMRPVSGRNLPPSPSHNRRPACSADTRIRRTWLYPLSCTMSAPVSLVPSSPARFSITDPDPVAPAKPHPGPSRTWPTRRKQFSFDKSAQVRPCSSQVIEPEESVLPPVLEELRDDVFTPSPSSQPSRAASTTATAPSTTDTVPSTTDTAPDTDSGAEDRRGQKRAVVTSDTSYSQEHRTAGTGPSNYPKRPNHPHTLTSSEEDEPPPRPRRPRSPGSDYSREHRAAAGDRHRYPKRHLGGRLLTLLGMD